MSNLNSIFPCFVYKVRPSAHIINQASLFYYISYNGFKRVFLAELGRKLWTQNHEGFLLEYIYIPSVQ